MTDLRPRILIAEDNRALGQVMKFNLERAHFDVRIAHDGQEAAEIVASEGCDLLFTDVEMPNMGGSELCHHLRFVLNMVDLPIVVCSARAYETSVQSMIEKYRLSHVFYKPMSPQAVVDFAKKLLLPELSNV